MALIVTQSPSKAYERICIDILNVSSICSEFKLIIQDATEASRILYLHEYLCGKRDATDIGIKSLNIEEYAKLMVADDTYSITQEWEVTKAAMQECCNHIETTFPPDQYLYFENGTAKYYSIPSSNLVTLHGLLSKVITTISS